MTLWTSEASTAMNSMTVIMPSNSHVKPIAPRINNRQQRDAHVDSTTPSTATSASKTSNKRKIAFHPSLGYAIPPPIPPKVARRNARERNRVKQVNNGFDVLRSHIPTAAKHKKMSKVDTLRHAVDYIRNLKKMLKEQDLSSGIKCEIDSDRENDDYDFDDDDISQQSFDDSIVSSPSSSSLTTFATSTATTTTTTSTKTATQFLAQQNTQNFPMTPKTPDSTSEFILNNVPSTLIPPATTLTVVGNENAYDAASYYSHPPSLVSPDSGHFSLHHHHNQIHPHHQQQQQQQHHHLLTPIFHPMDQHSPANSVETSPSLFSDSSAFFTSGVPATTVVPQSFYYSDCMEPNSEEDELLDAIVKWQDD